MERLCLSWASPLPFCLQQCAFSSPLCFLRDSVLVSSTSQNKMSPGYYVTGWLRAGSSAGKGREMQGLHWIGHKTSLLKPSASGFASWSALNKAGQRELSQRSLAEAEKDKPSPGLHPAWGRAVVAMAGPLVGTKLWDRRYGPASNTTLRCLYCIILWW